MRKGLKVIRAGEAIPLTDLDISERDWLLLARDDVEFQDVRRFKFLSSRMPPFFLIRFKGWSTYEHWEATKEGRRLFQPHESSSIIVDEISRFQVLPPKETDGLMLPSIESGFIGPYYVNRAYVGKDAIVKALKAEGSTMDLYVNLLEPQL